MGIIAIPVLTGGSAGLDVASEAASSVLENASGVLSAMAIINILAVDFISFIS
jgi:hypothetical protein